MNVVLALLDGGDMASQVKGEGIHLAFLAVVGGVQLACGIIGWLLLRAVGRNDADQKKLGEGLERVEEKVDHNDRRHGYEISDIKIAVAPLFRECDLDQPDYPSR